MSKKKQRLFEVIETIDKTFKPPLNEEFSDWYFTTKEVEASIWNIEKIYPNYEVDTRLPMFNVKWHIYPELRSYGIKSMDVFADSIFGNFYVDLLDKNTHDVVQEEVELDINSWKWEFETVNNTEHFGDAIFPTSMEFDFNDMTCTVTFG